MSLIAFSSVPFGNAQALREFLDLNAIEHDSVNDAIFDSGQEVDAMPLIADRPNQDWQFIHEEQHRQWSIALNLAQPPDLSGIDFANPVQFDDWIAAHAQHHSLVRSALGLS